jgi:hypothetical protein
MPITNARKIDAKPKDVKTTSAESGDIFTLTSFDPVERVANKWLSAQLAEDGGQRLI